MYVMNLKSKKVLNRNGKKRRVYILSLNQFLFRIKLSRFDHLTVFQARGANSDPFNSAVNVSLNPLQIRQPSPSTSIVSMTHLVPEHGTLTAYITNS